MHMHGCSDQHNNRHRAQRACETRQGVYPGYYLFFLHASVFSLAVSTMKKELLTRVVLDENKVPRSPRAYKAFEGFFCVVTQLLLDYVILPFRAMSVERSLAGWRSLNYIGHILVLGVLLVDAVFCLVPRRRPRSPTPDAKSL